MMFDCYEAKKHTVKDIYNYSKEDDLPMLSSYPSAFWKPYRDNVHYFDRLFMRKFTSFYPYGQEPGDLIDEVADSLRIDVYAWLLANDKRYSELFRVNTIPDNESYSLVNNYDLTETLQRTQGEDGTFVKGQMTTSESAENVYGAQSTSTESESVFGQQEIETEEEYAKGLQNNTSEEQVSAYNRGDYDPEKKRIDQEGSRTDTTSGSETRASHTDSNEATETKASYTDELSTTRQEGTRTDTSEKDITESHTLRRVGNMGVSTVDDMLQKHIATWEMFSFYDMIFSEIAREFLRC